MSVTTLLAAEALGNLYLTVRQAACKFLVLARTSVKTLDWMVDLSALDLFLS